MKKLRFFLSLGLILLAPSNGTGIEAAWAQDSASYGSEDRDLYSLASGLFGQKKYPAAAEQYHAFLRRFSNNVRAPDAQMMLAESLYQQALLEAAASEARPEKAFSEAAREFQEAEKRAPKGDLLAESAAFRLAEIQFNLKRFPEALQYLEKLKANYPGGLLRGEAGVLEAQALLTQGRAAGAVSRLRSVLQDQPAYQGEPRLSLTYGIALYEVGESSQAVSYLDPLQSPAADLYAGLALMRLGKPLVAVDKFRRIPRIDPDGEYVELSRYLIGESFYVGKDYLAAMQAYGDFVRGYPRSVYRPAALYKIGLCQFERDDYLSARGSFQSVLQLFPKNEFAELSLYMTGESFLKEARHKEAGFAYLDMASSYSDPFAGNAQFKLGWTLYKQGDLPGAESALRQMTLQRPSHPLSSAAAMLLGNVLAHQEHYGDAVMAYQQSLDLLAALPGLEDEKTDLREGTFALLNRASLLAQDFGRLVSGYQYVLKNLKPTLNPWRAATLLYVAEGYFRQGLYDEAFNLYQQVLASFPAAPESAFAQDGLAWCLFKRGRFAQAERERLKLEEYRRRPSVAPSETVLADGKLPNDLFVDNEFEEAVGRFNQKKYLDALDAYESFEKSHPDNALAAEAALQSGWCYYRLGYYAQAIKAWERTETGYPRSPAAAKAAWSTADTYFRAAQYDKAIATYQRILQTYVSDSSLDHARLKIAQSYYNSQDLRKAIAAFEDLLTQSPNSPEASTVLDLLTQLLYRPEAKADATLALQRIAQSHPGAPIAAQALFRVARSFFEASDYGGAADQLEQLTGNLPAGQEFADAQFYLAESYYNLKRYQEAALAYERFTSNYPGDTRFVGGLFHLGASRFQLKDFDGAAQAFEVVFRDHPKTNYAPVALYNSALAYRKLGKWEQAAQALKTYTKEYPDAAKTSDAPGELTAIYEEQRQFPLAVEAILRQRESLAKDDGLRLDLTFRLAEDYMAMGAEEKAVGEYQSLARISVARDQHRLAALAKLGEYYEQKELWSQAVDAYQDLARNAARADWAEAAQARVRADREKLTQSAIKLSTSAASTQVDRPAAGAGKKKPTEENADQ